MARPLGTNNRDQVVSVRLTAQEKAGLEAKGGAKASTVLRRLVEELLHGGARQVQVQSGRGSSKAKMMREVKEGMPAESVEHASPTGAADTDRFADPERTEVDGTTTTAPRHLHRRGTLIDVHYDKGVKVERHSCADPDCDHVLEKRG